MYVCINKYIYIYTYTYIYLHIHSCMHIYFYMHIHVFLDVKIYVYVCMSILLRRQAPPSINPEPLLPTDRKAPRALSSAANGLPGASVPSASPRPRKNGAAGSSRLLMLLNGMAGTWPRSLWLTKFSECRYPCAQRPVFGKPSTLRSPIFIVTIDS